MTPAKRLHGKAQLDPADYEFVTSGDNEEASQLASNPPVGYLDADMMKLWAAAVAEARENWRALRESVRPNSLQKCTHCGAYIRYFNIFRHVPTGERIVVGDTCAEDRMALDSRAALVSQQMHRAAIARAAALKIRVEGYAWIAAHEALWAQMLDARGDEFIGHMVEALAKYGNLTERQEAATVNAIAKVAQWTVAGATCELRDEFVEAPQGDALVVAGEVIKVEERENGYGLRVVMTVKTDAGWLAWGTVPAAISEVARGQRVQFTANLTRSERGNMAFINRPRKASIVEAVVA